MWNFKDTLWNSTQNILPIHWKIWFLYNIEILRALRFKSSYVFLKCPPDPGSPSVCQSIFGRRRTDNVWDGMTLEGPGRGFNKGKRLPMNSYWRDGGGGGGGWVLSQISDRDAHHCLSTWRNAARVKKGGLKLYILPNFYEKQGSKYDIFLIFVKIKGSKLYKFF